MAEAPPTPRANNSSQRWRRLGLLGSTTVTIIALIQLTVLALGKLDLRFDWSADGRFTLQPALAKHLQDLPKPVQITAIWPQTIPNPGWQELADYIDDRLTAIAALSPQVSYRRLDPQLDRPEIDRFSKQHGIGQAWYVYLTAKDARARPIPLSMHLKRSLQSQIGGHLAALARNQSTPAYVLSGFGESPLDGSPDGLGAFFNRLELSGFQPIIIDESRLSKRDWDRIPTDGVLVIPGPRQELGQDICQKIAAYLAAGGRCLLLIDDRCPKDLESLLANHGILIDRQVCYSRSHAIEDADHVLHRLLLDRNFGLLDTELSAQIHADGKKVVSPRSIQIGVVDGATVPTKERQAFLAAGGQLPNSLVDILAVQLGPIWQTPANERAPRAVAKEDVGKPIALARAVTYPPKQAAESSRVVIWGSSEAITNRWASEGRFANQILASDMLAWLDQRADRVAIDPQDFRRYEVHCSEGTLTIIMSLLVALLPATCVGIAILAWWERRSS